ncbi:MAG: asparagine synthase (glutamine-hydrolyzing) [Saprospiraceae bacterium]|nr:asparagine synthase (glutamine-hydrolyzing) [Saprospiraceae bacterium]HMW38980.1 asparagine synthase (glutamine-hydrolyzing) [Saprospiraceae bacterium]HMX87746.1 asparagine synthase (glutamine-hydrolyzing) [Saprospiraceae bacterium]HMZ39322.1 asparagine synthase (glutamine-hydrolyzing) [Saprospiraceae bacterium]HNA63638.1 asparagine synthase (glutamine-hydrolyzing) [Saprospiraceae bacterium]
MCGIYGYIGKEMLYDLDRIDALIAHRGPDDRGNLVWENVNLIHRRLAIQDLSPHGHQPMISDDGRYVIIFNGEIYNHRELRIALSEQFHFKSQSDTETLLYGFAAWGEQIFNKLNGIFALAILDKQSGILTLARDHFGVKPLYYYHSEGKFVFSSELKAVNGTEGIEHAVCMEGIVNYLYYLWSPGEKTAIDGMFKLGAGHYMQIRCADAEILLCKKYYELPFGQLSEIKNYKYWEKELEEKLFAAVERQLLSDVPVGFFLSGGLDSSLLTAIYRKLFPNRPIKAFTIRNGKEFEAEGFADDLQYAQHVAQFLNADLSIIPSTIDLVKDFDRMIWHLDEPQADLAPLHVENICRQARAEGYYVLLSGAGGDDLFSGYRRHQSIHHEKMLRYIPFANSLLRIASYLMTSPNQRRIQKYIDTTGKGHGMESLVNAYGWIGISELQELFAEPWRSKILSFDPRKQLLSSLQCIPDEHESLNKMLYWDIKYFLTDHNLNYTDKLSMSQGVEVRVPYLDRELVEFSTRLPVEYKMRGTTTKYILRKLAEKYLPKEVIYRPKTGFGAPVRHWFRNELRGWVDQRLNHESLVKQGVFNPEAVQAFIHKNQAGDIDGSFTILSLIAIESFIRQFGVNTTHEV